MITTTNTLTQTISYSIPVGTTVTGWGTTTIALYVTKAGVTRRYQSGISYTAPTTVTGTLSCTTDIDVASEGTYKLEFRYESAADIDVGDNVVTTPIASTIIRKVIDVNTTPITM